MASLKDIAAKTGLSMNTVSRAIRHSGYVSKHAQKLVDDAAKELNYKPNRAAQSLRSSRSFEVAVINIVSDPSSSCDSMAMDKVFGIKEYLTNISYEPNIHYIYSSDKYKKESEKVFNSILRQKPAGIIFLSEDQMAMKLYKQAEESDVPAILVSYAGTSEYDSVFVDRRQGVYDAVKYLINKGCRDIIFAGEDSSGQRIKGYTDALNESVLPIKVVSPDPIGNSTELSKIFRIGEKAAIKILSKYPEVDGIIAYSDYLAAGITSGLKDCGRKIPDDICIIGFDNRELAMFTSPPLSSIAQPNRELGRLTAEILLEKVQSKKSKKVQVKVKMALILRDSA
jgi:LacI family transcriptional regulator